jgi:hypothetical protein
MDYRERLFDLFVDAGTSPQEIIDGGLEQLRTNIRDLRRMNGVRPNGTLNWQPLPRNYKQEKATRLIADDIWDEAIKRIQGK